jgi:hypothetical protein
MARISVASYFYFMKREILGPVIGRFGYGEFIIPMKGITGVEAVSDLRRPLGLAR